MGSKDKKAKAKAKAADDKTPAPGPQGSPLGGMAWKVLSIGTTLVASKVATDVAQRGWKLATGKPVPIQGDYEKERTRDVIAFTALSAMLVTGARIAAERGAAEYYRHSSGHLPKALVSNEPSRKEKRAAKKMDKKMDRARARVGAVASAGTDKLKDAKDAVADKLPG